MSSPVPFQTLTLVTIAVTSAIAADAVPKSLPNDRYDTMSESSPFALASPTAPIAAPEAPSFATNWFVTGIGRLNDEDYVTIKARDLSMQFSLYGREANSATGVMLASVNWSETIGKSTVVLRKGTETAILEFNEAEMHAAPVASSSGPPRTSTTSLTMIPVSIGVNPQLAKPMMAPPIKQPPTYIASSGPKAIRPGGTNVLPPPNVNRPPNPGASSGNQPLNARKRIPQINPPPR